MYELPESSFLPVKFPDKGYNADPFRFDQAKELVTRLKGS